MFCPRCGTKAITGSPRYCYECGAEMSAAAGPMDQGADAAQHAAGPGMASSSAALPLGPAPMRANVIVKDNAMKTALMVVAALLLLPLALVLLFGAVVASLVAGVALVALVIKLTPLLAIGIVVYWLATRQRRAPQFSR